MIEAGKPIVDMLQKVCERAIMLHQRIPRPIMLNLDNLVKHTGVGKSFATKVSLSPSGLISISDAAVKKYEVDKAEYAVLYYEPQEKLVVIQLTNARAEGTIKIRQRLTGAYIAGASFVGNFEITLDATTTYDLQADQATGFLYFDLNKAKARRPARKSAKTENEEDSK